MKNKIWGKEGRTMLHNVLPLKTPFTIVIDPSSACNFKCKYCLHSLSNKQLEDINFSSKNMEYDLFIKIIDDLQCFPDKIKCLQLGKLGEPLINKDLHKMIRYAKETNKFERVEVITNGSLLTQQISMDLINAGLDVIRISMQGISKEKYYDLVGVDIDFNLFKNNIQHLYENRKQCLIHLKMIDIGLDNDEDKKKFYSMFENICDEMSIQYTTPVFDKYINYDELIKKKDADLFGDSLTKVSVCPRPFISMSISSDGVITPCCREESKEITFGNVKDDSIFEVWNSEKLRKFRFDQLNNRRYDYEICRNCYFPDTTTYEEDNLDKYASELINFYK